MSTIRPSPAEISRRRHVRPGHAPAADAGDLLAYRNDVAESVPREIRSISPNLEFAPWPSFDETDIEAVAAVLRSGRVNRWTGEENVRFEEEFAATVGCRHAIAVANGTLALELALAALGIGAGDEVVVSSRTFIASASAVVMRGATPVIADIDAESQNLTAATVEPLLTPRTRAIIAVHLAGWPCDMDSLVQLARPRGIKIIEDCAQAQGAHYRGRPVGSLGDVAAFSFCQDKIMTTGGEGGMLTTNDTDLWRRAWAYKDHGKEYEVVFHQTHPPGFRWLHNSFGTNWRMTEMQAALGRNALRKLPDWLAARRRHARILTETFATIPGLRICIPGPGINHAYYKYYVFVQPGELRPDRDRDWIMNSINAEGVPCNTGSCSEIYLEKAFERAGLQPVNCLPIARQLGETSLMFLVHPTLDEGNMLAIIDVVRRVMNNAVCSSGPGALQNLN